jgi:hypothetical protein
VGRDPLATPARSLGRNPSRYSGNPPHLDDALAAVAVKLSAEEIASLEAPYVPHAVAGFA